MQFEWDENKRLANIKKHGIDFRDVRFVFKSPHVAYKLSYKEELRWIATGLLRHKIVSVIFTRRSTRIRIISARKARKDEQRHYQSLYGK